MSTPEPDQDTAMEMEAGSRRDAAGWPCPAMRGTGDCTCPRHDYSGEVPW
jgi:hypothetical protein